MYTYKLYNTVPHGVTGNTPDLGSGDFQVRPLVGQQNKHRNITSPKYVYFI